jgi:hypothetical protein
MRRTSPPLFPRGGAAVARLAAPSSAHESEITTVFFDIAGPHAMQAAGGSARARSRRLTGVLEVGAVARLDGMALCEVAQGAAQVAGCRVDDGSIADPVRLVAALLVE